MTVSKEVGEIILSELRLLRESSDYIRDRVTRMEVVLISHPQLVDRVTKLEQTAAKRAGAVAGIATLTGGGVVALLKILFE